MSTHAFRDDTYTWSRGRRNPQIGSEGGRHTLRCIVCHVERPLAMFSQNQLRKKGFQTCKQCTPTPPTKLKCCVCLKTKAMDQFSKTQKKLNEHAKCMECMATIQADDSSDEGWDMDDDYI